MLISVSQYNRLKSCLKSWWNSIPHGSCPDMVSKIANYHHGRDQAADLKQSNRLKLWVWSWSLEKLWKGEKRIVWRWSREQQETGSINFSGSGLNPEEEVLLQCLPCESSGFRSAGEPFSEKRAWEMCLNFWLPVQEAWWRTQMLEWQKWCLAVLGCRAVPSVVMEPCIPSHSVWFALELLTPFWMPEELFLLLHDLLLPPTAAAGTTNIGQEKIEAAFAHEDDFLWDFSLMLG